MLQKKIIKLLVLCETSFKFVSEVGPLPRASAVFFYNAAPKEADCDMQVFLHTLFLEYALAFIQNSYKVSVVFI